MNVCEGKQEPKIKRMAEVTFDSYTHSLLMSYSCSLPFVSSLLSLIFFFFCVVSFGFLSHPLFVFCLLASRV